MKNLNEQQPLREEWGKENGRSYLCWRAEGYNSNFRCLDLGFGSVTEQTAVKQTHVTVTCDLWMHKVKFQTALWSCLLSHILHQDLPGHLGGNRVLGWVWGFCLFVCFPFFFSSCLSYLCHLLLIWPDQHQTSLPLLLDAHLLFLALNRLQMPAFLVSKFFLRPGRLTYLKKDSERVGKP